MGLREKDVEMYMKVLDAHSPDGTHDGGGMHKNLKPLCRAVLGDAWDCGWEKGRAESNAWVVAALVVSLIANAILLVVR